MSNEITVSLSKQIQDDYLAYSMAVLVGRAIPDIYDGLKPVQRRVLQTMLEEGLLPDRRYVKCARVTGLTMGFYHPHSGAYGALVNMATEWTNNVPWIDGHGNFGSSVDPPAAERYTECRLRQSAIDLLLQDAATWDTNSNYDGSRQEATRFNSSVPTILLNGDSGIAVGFSTRMAPHNLKSIAEAIQLICKDAATEKTKLENLRKARLCLIPDFPTGTQIVQDDQLETYTKTGSGGIRCVAQVERGVMRRDGKVRNRQTLSFTHLPPGTNPEKIGEQIKSEVEKLRIEGVSEIIDESDSSGDRLTVVTKTGVDLNLLQRQLYTFTDLDCHFSAKTLVIDGIKPVELSPVQIIQRWINWRLDRLNVKFEHELKVKQRRLHIVNGLLKSIDKLDAVIKKIKSSPDKKAAVESLMAVPLKLSQEQAEAVLEMRLRQLTGLNHQELQSESYELSAEIERLSSLIGDNNLKARKSYMVQEVTKLAKQHGSPRKSPIINRAAEEVIKSESKDKAVIAPIVKTRFVKIDMKKGVVEQTKRPKGSLAINSDSKLILMTEDGILKKVSATFKGTISTSYSPVALAKEATDVSKRKFLAVFKLEDSLKAMTLNGEDLCKTTSSGKKWLPDDAELVYFGEKPFTVEWKKGKKTPIKIDLTVKPGKPGSKGTKIANLSELNLNEIPI